MGKIKQLDPEQIAMGEHAIANKAVWNTSDPGTGKTIGSGILAYHLGRQRGLILPGQRFLGLAPKSILQSSWGYDLEDFNEYAGTDYTYDIAFAGKARQRAFEGNTDFVFTNYEGIKWLADNYTVAEIRNKLGFVMLNVDECTAFKNPQAQRTKAMLSMRLAFEWRQVMSGTPNAKTILDMFTPTLIVDDGDRLGRSYFQFRSQVATPKQNGPDPKHVTWVDKPGAIEQVTNALADITIRFELKLNATNSMRPRYTPIPQKVRVAYEAMAETSVYADPDHPDKGYVSAVNAAVRVNKMLQILTGSVYDTEGNAHLVATERYELVIELVKARKHGALVAYNWSHELEQLEKIAKREKLRYAVINGKVKDADRAKAVEDAQAGRLDCVFAHPQSASHGLTFTRFDGTIWSSPTNRPELFLQFNRRVYRKGQDKNTEVITIAARDTKEDEVYERLNDSSTSTMDLLSVLSGITQEKLK